MLAQWGIHLALHTPPMAAIGLPALTAQLRAVGAPAPASLATRARLDTLVGVELVFLGLCYTLGLGRLWARGADDRWALLG
jgi:hypothetical protein